jgi:hypothetical protein
LPTTLSRRFKQSLCKTVKTGSEIVVIVCNLSCSSLRNKPLWKFFQHVSVLLFFENVSELQNWLFTYQSLISNQHSHKIGPLCDYERWLKQMTNIQDNFPNIKIFQCIFCCTRLTISKSNLLLSF